MEHDMRITSTTDPLRILLVEDSKGDALLIKQAIKEAMPDAHSIAVATKLEEGLKMLSAQEFDMALLDRSLPDAQGFDGLHNLQTMAPELPIVYLTGNQDQQIAFDSIEQGAQDYLYKNNMDGHR